MMNPIISDKARRTKSWTHIGLQNTLAVKSSGQVNQKWVVKACVSVPANGNNHNLAHKTLINTSQDVFESNIRNS